MKKKIVAIVLIVAIILAVSGCSRIRISEEEQAVILMDAKHNSGIGGCPYTEKVSISFGNQVFLLATDGCHTICDMQNEKYYEVSSENWAYIASLFEYHGGRL